MLWLAYFMYYSGEGWNNPSISLTAAALGCRVTAAAVLAAALGATAPRLPLVAEWRQGFEGLHWFSLCTEPSFGNSVLVLNDGNSRGFHSSLQDVALPGLQP